MSITKASQDGAAQDFNLNRLKAEALTEIRAERDRLLTINAELLAALRKTVAALGAAVPQTEGEAQWIADALAAARATIAKAEGRA